MPLLNKTAIEIAINPTPMTDLEKLLEKPLLQRRYVSNLYTADDMKDAYNLGFNADKWVSVSERLPEDKMFSVLVYGSYTADCPRRSMEVHFYRKGNRYEFRSMDGVRTKNVTHWQPLPQK